MTSTATETAPAVATWGSWKTHGNKAELMYFGQSRKAPVTPAIRIRVQTSASGMYFINVDNDKQIGWGGYATRFWAAPVETDEDETDEAKAEIARDLNTPVTHTQAVVRAAQAPKRPSRNAKLHGCTCGCGQQVRGLYKQGHDARHASEVAHHAIAQLLTNPDINLADSGLFDVLPTSALQSKAANIVAKRIK